jgi:hypothetical protein
MSGVPPTDFNLVISVVQTLQGLQLGIFNKYRDCISHTPVLTTYGHCGCNFIVSSDAKILAILPGLEDTFCFGTKTFLGFCFLDFGYVSKNSILFCFVSLLT